MCGINGIVHLTGQENTEALRLQISSMNKAVSHRGPDGEGEYIGTEIALGHRRLSILDLTPAGAQPMHSDDGALTLVFNGEIYNYLELMLELKACGHVFSSTSDTEVLLRAYQEWGPACIQRFNGMWAFAIWDSRHRRLFASRDRFGVKPFYFSLERERLLFSSEIKGIAAIKNLPEANLDKVHDYLRYGYCTNDGATFFRDVNQLLPGHNLTVENGSVQVTRYWALASTAISGESDSALCDRFSALLEDAVRLRFRSDVPVALLQSGGLDSSAICRVVDDAIENQSLGCKSVTAFTAVFPGFKNDESATARELIRSCRHIQQIEIAPTERDIIDKLPQFMGAMGEPVFNSISFVHWQIMRAVHQHGIKVILNGQGADEAFAGYGPYNVGYRLLDTLFSEPLNLVRQARGMHEKLGMGATAIIAQTAKAMLGRRAASKWRASMVEGGAQVLESSFRQQHDRYLPESSVRFGPRNLDQHLRSQLLLYGFNQILHYEDHSAMLHSVEMRSPFVDYRLMEFAFTLPDRLKFDQGVTKVILRKAFSKRLPQSIVNNHYKIGFATPFSQWMQTKELQAFMRDITHSKSFCERTIWRAAELHKRFAQSSRYSAFPFWRFINMELWARANGISNL